MSWSTGALVTAWPQFMGEDTANATEGTRAKNHPQDNDPISRRGAGNTESGPNDSKFSAFPARRETNLGRYLVEPGKVGVEHHAQAPDDENRGLDLFGRNKVRIFPGMGYNAARGGSLSGI